MSKPPSVPTVGTCECGLLLVGDIRWRGMDPAVRESIKETHARHVCRGLCHACYWAARRSSRLVDYERRNHSRDEVLEAWESDGHRAGESRAERVRRLAPRLGMTPAALDRAILRANRRAA